MQNAEANLRGSLWDVLAHIPSLPLESLGGGMSNLTFYWADVRLVWISERNFGIK